LPEEDSNGRRMYRNSLPVPDPTVLTTQQLSTAISALKELFDVRVSSIEKAMEALTSGLEERSKEIREAVKHLERLHEEKFIRIQTQILERDVQTDKASRDVKAAVDAAFAAAKEAVGEQNKSNALAIGKSETSVLKLIDGISEIIKTNDRTNADKIGDLKDRLTIIESTTKGMSASKIEAVQTNATNWGFVVGGVGLVYGVVASIGIIVTLGAKLLHQ
jgi:hypothetical protein